MNEHHAHPVRQMLDGTVRIFLAEAIVLPTGLLIVIFLSRKLGPENYGLYNLAAAIVSWIGWTIVSVFTRSTIKFAGETEDWQPIGTAVTRLAFLLSALAVLLIWLFADLFAVLLNEPALAKYLRLYAIEIPLLGLASAHKNILLGLGRFRERAVISSCRWIIRLALIVLLVQMGFSLVGAILGSVGAAFIELLICRIYIRPSPFHKNRFPMRLFWEYSIPLFLFAFALRIFDKLDLLTFKVFGGLTAEVGIYAAAQNLTLMPGIFAFSFSNPLLSTLSRLLHTGRRQEALQTARGGMRVVLLLLPFAGMTAGAAAEIVKLVFGAAYAPAGPLLAILIFAALALVMISVSSAIMTAAGKPTWTFALAGPIIPFALVGYVLFIPRFGIVGAASVTTLVAVLDALASVLLVQQLWGILPPVKTAVRSSLVCLIVYLLVSAWKVEGFLVVAKLALATIFIGAAYFLLREIDGKDLELIKSSFGARVSTTRNPGEL